MRNERKKNNYERSKEINQKRNTYKEQSTQCTEHATAFATFTDLHCFGRREREREIERERERKQKKRKNKGKIGGQTEK